MPSRRTALWICSSVLLTVAGGFAGYQLGLREGFERGQYVSSTAGSVTTGVQAVLLVRNLDEDRKAKVREGLDLMIDQGIAAHYLRRRVRDTLGSEIDDDETLDGMYERLLAHRRERPSTVPTTRHLGPMVEAALRLPAEQEPPAD